MIDLIKGKIASLMSDEKFSEILKGSTWALGLKALSMLLAIVTNIIIARFYGAGVMGIVAVINSFLLFATIFTVLGTDTLMLRFIPQHIAEYSYKSAFTVYRKAQYFVLSISVLSAVFLYLISDMMAELVFSKPHLSFFFALSSVFVIFKSLAQLNTQAMRGLRLIKTFAFMQALPFLAMLLILVLTTFLFRNPNNPVYAQLFAWFISGIAAVLIINRSFKKKMVPSGTTKPVSLKNILSISLPMLMSTGMIFVTGQTGVILLGIFRTEAEVGYYAVAVKLATLTAFVLQAVNSMAAPKFSELFHRGEMDDLFYVARKSTRIIFWTTGPLLLGLIILGRPVLSVLFGQDFAVAYPSLVFLSIGQFVNSVSGSTGIFMNMTGHEKKLSNILLGAAVMNVAMGLLLIPSVGMIGAALSGMTSIAFWNIYTLLYIKFKYGRTIGYFPGCVFLSRNHRL
jgi:O-antigen/teichoic acid export membrane protein